MVQPEICELFVRQQFNMRLGKSLAQSLQRRGCHHCVTQPIDPAYQDTARFGKR